MDGRVAIVAAGHLAHRQVQMAEDPTYLECVTCAESWPCAESIQVEILDALLDLLALAKRGWRT